MSLSIFLRISYVYVRRGWLRAYVCSVVKLALRGNTYIHPMYDTASRPKTSWQGKCTQGKDLLHSTSIYNLLHSCAVLSLGGG